MERAEKCRSEDIGGRREASGFCFCFLEASKDAAGVYEYRAAGQQEDAASKYEQLMNYFNQIEPEVHNVFDPVIFNSTMAARFRK